MLEYVAEKKFASGIKVKGLKIGWSSWIVLVGSVQGHEPLKVDTEDGRVDQMQCETCLIFCFWS